MITILLSQNETETVEIGKTLARGLGSDDVIILSGPLGAGKTVFTKGVCAGLGIDKKTVVRSPTFTMIQEYRGPTPVRHVDLYRAQSRDDLASIGLFDTGIEGITIIEWGEKLASEEIRGAIKVTINVREMTTRQIVIEAPADVLEKAEFTR